MGWTRAREDNLRVGRLLQLRAQRGGVARLAANAGDSKTVERVDEALEALGSGS